MINRKVWYCNSIILNSVSFTAYVVVCIMHCTAPTSVRPSIHPRFQAGKEEKPKTDIIPVKGAPNSPKHVTRYFNKPLLWVRRFIFDSPRFISSLPELKATTVRPKYHFNVVENTSMPGYLLPCEGNAEWPSITIITMASVIYMRGILVTRTVYPSDSIQALLSSSLNLSFKLDPNYRARLISAGTSF